MARQKTVYPSSEIAHLWAHRTQPSARNQQGNFYFDGDTIYSYGSHFPIARHVVSANGQKAILLTTRTYSNTTSGHVGAVRQSIPSSVPVFETSDVWQEPSRIMQSMSMSVDTLIKDLRSAKPKPQPPAKKPTAQKYKLEPRTVTIKGNFDGGSKEISALCGKRLAAYQTSEGSSWTVGPIEVGLSACTGLTRIQARALVYRLDSIKDWTVTGKKLSELGAKVNAARAKVVAATVKPVLPATLSKKYRRLSEEIADAKQFAAFFGLKTRAEIPSELIDWLRPIDQAYQVELTRREGLRNERRRLKWANYEKRQETAKAERAAKLPELIAEWRAGGYVNSTWDFPTMLRIDGLEVETSLGARFPLSHAVKVLPMVLRLIDEGQTFQTNGHTIRLGHYKLERIDESGTIYAGCHQVSKDELKHFAGLVAGLPVEERAELLAQSNERTSDVSEVTA